MAVPVRAELIALLGELGHRVGDLPRAPRASHDRERFELVACRWPAPTAPVRAGCAARRRAWRALAARACRRAPERRAPTSTRSRRGCGSTRLCDRVRIAARAARIACGGWPMLAHPDRPLERGFVRVTDRAGRTLTKVADAAAAHDVDAPLRRRRGRCRPLTDGESRAAPPARRARVERKPAGAVHKPPQPGLFDAARGVKQC